MDRRAARVTVITPSVPGRDAMLVRNERSVAVQDPLPVHHVMAGPRADDPRGDLVAKLNRGLALVETDFAMRLDDDDYLLDHHTATVESHDLDAADVWYTYDAGHTVPMVDVTGWDQDEVVHRLHAGNFITGSGTWIRTETLRSIGGFVQTHARTHYEDWAVYITLAEAGARFACIPTETFFYDNGTHEQRISLTVP